MTTNDRRQFQRLQAPVLCRPVGRPLFGNRRAIDVSSGGIRIYSDDSVEVGSRLELELYLPEGNHLVCKAEVVWIDELPQGSPAVYDVGLRFLDLKAEDQERLKVVLDSHVD